MCAKNLVKVTGIGGVMSRKGPLTLRNLSLKFAIKMALSKHVVLIMQIIMRIIKINMDDIRPERPNEDPILKLNKRFK